MTSTATRLSITRTIVVVITKSKAFLQPIIIVNTTTKLYSMQKQNNNNNKTDNLKIIQSNLLRQKRVMQTAKKATNTLTRFQQ